MKIYDTFLFIGGERITIVAINTPMPSTEVPIVVTDTPEPSTSNSSLATSLIIGLTVGLVGCVIVAVLVTTIVVSVVLVRQHKSTTAHEQPFYEYIAPPQPPALSERIVLKENEAYGHIDTRGLDSTRPMQPNAAYGVVQPYPLPEVIQ